MLFWYAAAFILLSGCLAAAGLTYQYRQDIRAGERLTQSYARVIEEQTARTLQTIDQRLQLAIADLTRADSEGIRASHATGTLLREHMRELPFVRMLVLIDAHGQVVADSEALFQPRNLADRPYFRRYLDQPATTFSIGEPLRGRTSGIWLVTAARPLAPAGSAFEGILVAAVEPRYFDQVWQTAQLGNDSSVALLRDDGVLMMRSPPVDEFMGRVMPELAAPRSAAGKPFPQGFWGRSPIDRGARYFAPRAVSAYPGLTVMVGQREGDMLAPWYRFALLTLAIWACGSLGIVALCRSLNKLMRAGRRAEGERRQVFERITDAFVAIDRDWCYTYVNQRAAQMLGAAPAQLVGRSFWTESPAHLEPRFRTMCTQSMQTQKPAHLETFDVRTGRWLENRVYPSPEGLTLYFHDVTARKHAEESLQRSEALQLSILDSVGAEIAVLDEHGVVVALNEPWQQSSRTGIGGTDNPLSQIQVGSHYRRECAVGDAQLESPLTLEVCNGIERVLEGSWPSFNIEYPSHTPQRDSWLTLHVTPLHPDGHGAVLSRTDISGRKAAEEKLRNVTRLYALRSQINHVVVRTRQQDELFRAICDVAIDFGRFRMAWIGLIRPQDGVVRAVAHAGEENGYLQQVVITTGDIPAEASVGDERPREPDVLTSYDLAIERRRFPWRDEALKRGYRSFAAVSFSRQGTVVGALTLYAEEPGFFTTSERRVLRGIGQDISFALDAMASEADRKRVEEALRGLVQEKEALLREVHHRVKNNLQVVSSLLRLEAGRSALPATALVLRDMQDRIHAMALLHETLYRSGTFAAVDLGAYLGQLAVQSFRALASRPDVVRLVTDLIPLRVGLDQAIPAGLLVNELISNCFKHGFPDGRPGTVWIELRRLDGDLQLQLRVRDDGVGLPADFENRRAHGLGLQLVNDLAGQLGGEFSIAPGPHADFSVTFHADPPVPATTES